MTSGRRAVSWGGCRPTHDAGHGDALTLRVRLLLALLALALLPTLAFTLFTLDQLSRATDRWYLPGVDRALEAGLEVSRAALTRIEATALERADDWAAGMGPLPLDASRRAGLRDGLREAGLDFAQVYVREGTRWRLADQVVPAGVLALDGLDFSSEIDSTIATSRLLRSPQGALAALARSDTSAALVVGVRLTPDFFDRLDEVGQARGLYQRLGVLVQVQRSYVWMLVAALSVALLIAAAFLARMLSSDMTRPLQSLSQGFERVAGGDLSARVPEQGAREMQLLAASFNRMTGNLAEARTQLATAEREAAWREVARRLAHEIKNPLTPMRLSLHRLQRRVDLVPEEQRPAVRDSLNALIEEVEHLTQLAEQFSQYARLPEPRHERFDLAALARSAAALHEPEHATIQVHGDGPHEVIGDRLLLSRAVHNLVLNACEASPPGAIVEVRTGARAQEVWLEVLDRGPGLPADLGDKVFEPYVSTKNRGSGLGLSLVRDIATQHGGRVSIENREGGGAQARLTLPASGDEHGRA